MHFKVPAMVLAAGALLFSAGAAAQGASQGFLSGWSGKGEFGLVKTTGNSETESVNMALEFVRESERWRHRISAGALTSSKDGTDDAERYTFELQSDRKLSDVNYVFGAFRWDSDKFGAYDPATTITFGYGHKLIETERHKLKGEAGIGYRDQEDRLTGESDSEAILRLLLDDTFQVTDNTQWVNRLLVESGSDNTFTQFNTGLSVAMNESFAVKVGFEARNNSDVPPGTDKNDTKTTVNLVYNF